MATPFLSAHDLQVRYDGALVLDVPHLEVMAGEILVVMGPNGAGKSTLLRVLGLLETPRCGQLAIGGEPVPTRRRARLALQRCFTSVFEAPLLLDDTVEGNVGLGPRLRGVRDGRHRVTHWLRHFGVEALRKRRARTLSAGEARRVCLARAFVLEPQLLLLDEPFAALDPPTRHELVADLRAVLAVTRVTTVLVTHDGDEALALADRVAVMVGGRIRQLDAAARLFARPADAEVARIVRRGADRLSRPRPTPAEPPGPRPDAATAGRRPPPPR